MGFSGCRCLPGTTPQEGQNQGASHTGLLRPRHLQSGCHTPGRWGRGLNMSLWDSLKTGGPGEGRAEQGGKHRAPAPWTEGGQVGVRGCPGAARLAVTELSRGAGAGWRERRGAHGAARGTRWAGGGGAHPVRVTEAPGPGRGPRSPTDGAGEGPQRGRQPPCAARGRLGTAHARERPCGPGWAHLACDITAVTHFHVRKPIGLGVTGLRTFPSSRGTSLWGPLATQSHKPPLARSPGQAPGLIRSRGGGSQ